LFKNSSTVLYFRWGRANNHQRDDRSDGRSQGPATRVAHQVKALNKCRLYIYKKIIQEFLSLLFLVFLTVEIVYKKLQTSFFIRDVQTEGGKCVNIMNVLLF
jgi:hypothetical protein